MTIIDFIMCYKYLMLLVFYVLLFNHRAIGQTHEGDIIKAEIFILRFSSITNASVKYENITNSKKYLNDGGSFFEVKDKDTLMRLGEKLEELTVVEDASFYENLRLVILLTYNDSSVEKVLVNNQGIIQYNNNLYLLSRDVLEPIVSYLPDLFVRDINFFFDKILNRTVKH